MGIPVSLKVLDSNSTISKNILSVIKEVLNEAIVRASDDIVKRLREVFKNTITNDDTWLSLQSDDLSLPNLKAEFGLPSGEVSTRLNNILNEWLKQILVRPVMLKGTTVLRGGLELMFLDTNWKDVIELRDSIVTTHKGKELNWLDWLLTKGDTTIIREYHVRITPGAGRSELGVMVKKGRWHVPREFSGTTNNNFVTKIIDHLFKMGVVENIIEQEITNQLG
jgi:hypothetical protein